MDVVALLSSSGSVTAYRITWTKIWSLAGDDDKVVTSIEWKPDGLLLAIGWNNGMVELHDIGIDTCVRRLACGTAAIERIHWADNSACVTNKLTMSDAWTEDPSLESITKRLPPLEELPRPGTGDVFSVDRKSNASTIQQAPWLKPSDVVDLLVVANREHVFVCGMLDLKVYRLEDIVSVPDVKFTDILSIKAFPDLSKIALLLRGTVYNGQDIIQQAMVGTGLTGDTLAEMQLLARKAWTCESLLTYISEAYKALEGDYKRATELTGEYVNAFQQILDDHNEPNATPKIELLGMLGTGTPSEPVNLFLQRHLTPRGLKKWTRQTDSGWANMRILIIKHIQPAGERLLLSLTDMLGQSRWEDSRRGDAARTRYIEELIHMSSAFLLVANELLDKIEKEANAFKEFALWLNQAVELSAAEDGSIPRPKYSVDNRIVADFIRNSLTGDPLSEYFSSDGKDLLSAIDQMHRPEKLDQLRGYTLDPPRRVKIPRSTQKLPRSTSEETMEEPVTMATFASMALRVLKSICSIRRHDDRPILYVEPLSSFATTVDDSPMSTQETSTLKSSYNVWSKGGEIVLLCAIYEPNQSSEFPPHIRLCKSTFPSHPSPQHLHLPVGILSEETLETLQKPSSTLTTVISLAVGPSLDAQGEVLLAGIEGFDEDYLAVLLKAKDADSTWVGLFNWTVLDFQAVSKDNNIMVTYKVQLQLDKMRQLDFADINDISTNGRPGRRVACILSHQRRHAVVYDMDAEEAQDDED